MIVFLMFSWHCDRYEKALMYCGNTVVFESLKLVMLEFQLHYVRIIGYRADSIFLLQVSLYISHYNFPNL